MTNHITGTREEWLSARLDLLKAEKEHTRMGDELARRRQELPWVRVAKAYTFETEEGKASLLDLFRGRTQLLIYHFMFGPDYSAGCPSCSAIADGFNGSVIHLANHDVTLCAVSRAPLANLLAYKKRMGWTFPWVSAFGSDFNADSSVGLTRNSSGKAPSTTTTATSHRWSGSPHPAAAPLHTRGPGTDLATYLRERPGVSAFALEDGAIHHTYSAYARGVDGLWGMFQWLDRAPRGETRRPRGGGATTNASGRRTGTWPHS
jgi:predicted dithiol-disulfide oxidoreductase (DUF899 family)